MRPTPHSLESMAHDLASAPPAFRDALRSIAGASTRADVHLTETPAPSRIAPYALAVDGELRGADAGVPEARASGRFVVLHDPAGQDAWDGDFRIVVLVKATVEAEVGSDDLWADVAWAWLDEALADTSHRARGGTVTKTVSRSFGELADRPSEVNVELRVSWTPVGTDLEPHLQAWTTLLALCGGVPPLPDGVTMLPGRAL